jgi:hypothetical protein
MRLQNDAEQQRQADQQQARNDPPARPQLSPEANRFAEAIKYRRYRWADFDETIFAKDLIVSQDMMGLMAESRYAADVAYYLGKHKDISAQISRLPLPEAAARIKVIENSVVAEAEHSQ